MDTLKRQYAYFHRILLELLTELVAESTTYWLSNKQGHLPRAEGEANSYRKALYVVEELEPYRKRLTELETIQQAVMNLAIAKPVGVLLPLTFEAIGKVVLSQAVSWSSHAYPKEKVLAKLTGALGIAKKNLRAFDTYAMTDDPYREAVMAEILELERGLEQLRQFPEATLRERARSEKHTARLYPLADRGEVRMVYIRDVGLIVAGPGLTQAECVHFRNPRERRSDRMEGRLEPLLVYGNYEIYSERGWQHKKNEV